MLTSLRTRRCERLCAERLCAEPCVLSVCVFSPAVAGGWGRISHLRSRTCPRPPRHPKLAQRESLPVGPPGGGRPSSPRLFPQWSFAVATITEIPPLIILPNFLVQRKVLKPLRTQTGGTIMVGGGAGPPAPAPSLPGPGPTWGLPSRMPRPLSS